MSLGVRDMSFNMKYIFLLLLSKYFVKLIMLDFCTLLNKLKILCNSFARKFDSNAKDI